MEKIDPQKAGLDLAFKMKWEGERIFLTALYALEDSNFHTVSRALIEAWEKVEGPLNG